MLLVAGLLLSACGGETVAEVDIAAFVAGTTSTDSGDDGGESLADPDDFPESTDGIAVGTDDGSAGDDGATDESGDSDDGQGDDGATGELARLAALDARVGQYTYACINRDAAFARTGLGYYLSWVDIETGPVAEGPLGFSLGVFPLFDDPFCENAVALGVDSDHPVDVAARRFQDAHAALEPVVAEQVVYFDRERYLDDDFAGARDLHAQTMPMFAELLAAEDELRTLLRPELERIHASDRGLTPRTPEDGRHRRAILDLFDAADRLFTPLSRDGVLVTSANESVIDPVELELAVSTLEEAVDEVRLAEADLEFANGAPLVADDAESLLQAAIDLSRRLSAGEPLDPSFGRFDWANVFNDDGTVENVQQTHVDLLVLLAPEPGLTPQLAFPAPVSVEGF